MASSTVQCNLLNVRLGADPKSISDKIPMVTFRVAEDRSYLPKEERDKAAANPEYTPQWRELTEWHNVVCLHSVAKRALSRLQKGSLVSLVNATISYRDVEKKVIKDGQEVLLADASGKPQPLTTKERMTSIELSPNMKSAIIVHDKAKPSTTTASAPAQAKSQAPQAPQANTPAQASASTPSKPDLTPAPNSTLLSDLDFAETDF